MKGKRKKERPIGWLLALEVGRGDRRRRLKIRWEKEPG